MGLLSTVIKNSESEKELKKECYNIVSQEENIERVFRLARNMFIFTDKRLIIIDKQGLLGKKTEYSSILYRSITRFSIETAYSFDSDAELKVWITGDKQPSVYRKITNTINIYELQKILASHTLV